MNASNQTTMPNMKPSITAKCAAPASGRLNIFVWPKVCRSVVPRRCHGRSSLPGNGLPEATSRKIR